MYPVPMGFSYEAASLAPTGLDPSALARLEAEADRAAAHLPGAAFVADLARPVALPPRAKADRVVVLGIGGSALGTRAVHAASPGRDILPILVVDNIDPQPFEEAWQQGDPRRTAWVVVSKSGGTTETLAQFGLLRRRLGEGHAGAGVHVVTGAKGPLRELAVAERLMTHEVPEAVGGRFSVFTPAATVPLALAGHDCGALLDGARAGAAAAARAGSAAARLAALLVASAQSGRNVVAFWSYAERLETVGEWFRQLWAESLGKIRPDGRRTGQTPVHCVGSTDQHSIQQLMVEGPPDKAVLVLAGPPTAQAKAPDSTPGAAAGHSLAGILDAMRRATSAAMVRAGCPLATLRLGEWNERAMGGLLMALLAATVIGGDLLGVNPYGQPGVEAAKLATRSLLGDPKGVLSAEIGALLGEGRGIPGM